ncbi:MAG: hypothetical protein ACOY46_08265 [Bacillota bacterium]
MLILSTAAAGAGQTYSYLATLARSQIGSAETAAGTDILKVEGTFNEIGWPGSGGSGIKITNVTNSTVWVFFDIRGSISNVVKHISPVGLEAGQTYELPLDIADPGDLGMLKWRNDDLTFSGEIVIRVLNNFSSYRIGNIEFSGKRLFDRLLPVDVETTNELSRIKTIRDIVNLIAEKNALLRQVNQLIELNNQLQAANENLQRQLTTIQSALQQASQAQSSKPPQPESGNSGQTGTPTSENPGQEDSGLGEQGQNTEPSLDPANSGNNEATGENPQQNNGGSNEGSNNSPNSNATEASTEGAASGSENTDTGNGAGPAGSNTPNTGGKQAGPANNSAGTEALMSGVEG